MFFDETETEWSADGEEFLRKANGVVRGCLSGFGDKALVSGFEFPWYLRRSLLERIGLADVQNVCNRCF